MAWRTLGRTKRTVIPQRRRWERFGWLAWKRCPSWTEIWPARNSRSSADELSTSLSGISWLMLSWLPARCEVPWVAMPCRCEPGMTRMQPFSMSLSSTAIHAVCASGGSSPQ